MTATTLPFFFYPPTRSGARGFGNDVEEEIRMACCIIGGRHFPAHADKMGFKFSDERGVGEHFFAEHQCNRFTG